MRGVGVLRETAAAFGDVPSSALASAVSAVKGVRSQVANVAKPVGAKLSVAVPTKPASGAKVSVSAKVQAPKLQAVVASSAPKVAPAAKPVAPRASVATPVASPRVAAPARPAVAAPTAYAANANQANFLDGGSAPIASAVLAPTRTAAQVESDKRAIEAAARARGEAEALALADRNAAYARQRQADTAASMATTTDGVKQPWEKANAGDFGQITMGAKVLAIGASVIATGGAAAGALGVTAAGGSLAAAAAADRLVAAVERGGELGKQASSVISDVKAAAAKGDKAAKDALAVVNDVTSGRLAAGVQAGVEQTLSSAGAAAANALAGVAATLTGSGSLNQGALAAQLTAAAAEQPSGGYTPISVAPRTGVSASASAALARLSALFGPEGPRWLVTPDARVVDLDRTPSQASAKGFLVGDGKVVRQ